MIQNNDKPQVTVALPVYNEERHISKTLDSLIAQDYPNLEILISDNCSTDKTGVICQEYAEKDQRIVYKRHHENIGVAANHILIARRAQGKYFMFAAGHDYWSKNLVSQSVQLLERFETATVAFGTPSWIGEEGKSINKFQGWYDTRGLNPVARFFMVFWGSMNPILGIIRRKEMPDLENYNFAGADLVVLAELAFKGEFLHAVDASFYRRQNRPVEDYSEKMKRYKSREMKIEGAFFYRLFPLTRLPLELLRVVLQAKLRPLEKILTIALLLPSLPIRYILGKKDSTLK